MMTSQENVSDAFPLSTFQWSKLWVICNNSQFWFSWSWLLMNESKLQHMAYKHCVQNQSKKLVFLSHFVFRQHLMDHNFHNVYNRKDDALERWVSFSYRDGFTHRLKKGQTLHQSSIQKRVAVLLCLVSPFFLPCQTWKGSLNLNENFPTGNLDKFSSFCVWLKHHSILERKWNHSTSNKKRGVQTVYKISFGTLHSIEKLLSLYIGGLMLVKGQVLFLYLIGQSPQIFFGLNGT